MKTNMMNIFVAAFLVMGGLSHIPLPACQAVASSQGDERRLVVVSDLELVGEIEGENISFTLAMNADVDKRRSQLALVSGDVAYIGGELPRKAELSRANSTYMLEFGRSGNQTINFRFASRPIRQGEWRRTRFAIPAATVRKLSVICDRSDLEIDFPGALDVQKDTTDDGRTRVTAYLGIADFFEVTWKPEVRKLTSELAVTCDVNAMATAGVGAMQLDSIFTYRVIQGALNELRLALPDVHVTQVLGPDIQDWRVEETPEGNVLAVQLSRPQEGVYRLRVLSELLLPSFPCKSTMPVFAPQDVLRTSGFLMLGTDSAIKLQINKASGVSQVDPRAFPTVALKDLGEEYTRRRPVRSMFVYQYASTPYALDFTADDIVTSFAVDDRLIVTLEDNDLVFEASVELDIKDAPAREIVVAVESDPAWTVTSVSGAKVADADVDVSSGEGADVRRRTIRIPFKQSVSGVTLVTVRMERSLPADRDGFDVPVFSVSGARSERGYLVVGAETGIRLRPSKVEGLREVHTGSAPMQVPGAQQAFRFKSAGWSLSLSLQRARPTLHSEVFHLVSLGEGVMYCSAAISYHVGGAPIQSVQVHVPETIETVEFTGADIEGWTREGETCTVRLQTRIMGDYTLLVTYDSQHAYEGAAIRVGDVETIGTDSEVGYVVVASAVSLKLDEVEARPDWLFAVDRTEIPSAYAATVTDPIIAAYKYVRGPHPVALRVEPFKTESLIEQIADYVELATRVSRDGESITTVDYFIKNATRQYLVAKLPEGVDLWSVRRVDDDGKSEDILPQESEAGLLIPVSRLPDPNTALHLQVVYAQNHGKLGFWRGGIKGLAFWAPALTQAHATFARWSVEVPDSLAIAGTSGNMASESRQPRGGLLDVSGRTARLAFAVADGLGGWTIRDAVSLKRGNIQKGVYTRTVNLADDNALSLNVRVAPPWLGSAGSGRLLVLLVLAGVLMLARGLYKKSAGFLIALGVTHLAAGIAQAAMGRSVLAVVLYLSLLFWVLFWFTMRGGAKLLWRFPCWIGRGLAYPFRRRTPKELPVDDISDPWEYDKDTPPALHSAERDGETSDTSGFTTIRLLLTILTGSLLTTALASEVVVCPPPARQAVASPQGGERGMVPIVIMDAVEMEVQGPAMARDAEQSAALKMHLVFETDDPGEVHLLPVGAVLTDFTLDDDDLEIVPRPDGYVLEVKKRGEYELTIQAYLPVTEKNGQWSLPLHVPQSLRNRMILTLPEVGMEVASVSAVRLLSSEADGATETEMVFVAGGNVTVTWRPRARETKLEESVYYCDVTTTAMLRPGVVDLQNVIRYQIAQGEVKEMKARIPAGMAVTAVHADGLATWSFDPVTSMLEAILEKPAVGSLTIAVVTQVASEGLPYAATIGVPSVEGAARQRGVLAFSAPDSIQVRVGESTGLNSMNIEDFEAMVATPRSHKHPPHLSTTRKAYRYSQPTQVSARVEAEQVLPELRAVESATLSIADERIVLATRLALTVLRSGVFSVALDLPADYEVETLTGSDVDHWDEVSHPPHDSAVNDSAVLPADDESLQRVIVHFNRQVTGNTELNMVVARTEKGVEERIVVPRIHVASVHKHSGRITISGERGIRLMVAEQRGVDLKKASEQGIRQPGVLVFGLLRPTWSIVLKSEVMAPAVTPEVLQWTDLAEGMLQVRCFVRYKVENAGVKSFRLKVPVPGVSLTVTGRNIARVHEIDREQGLWQVDLHSKVENTYPLMASYQLPYDTAAQLVTLKPLQMIDTEDPRGYLVVTCGGRVQVRPSGTAQGLKVEDPRNVPSVFGAGELSDAILCYRTLRSDYALDLSVVRHDAAGVLPARIDKARIRSALSTGGKLLTQVKLDLTVRRLRFLKFELPHKDDSLWAAQVNGREVQVSRDEGRYCIPLEEDEDAAATTVEFIYAGSADSGALSRRREYRAPRFELPQEDIEWELFAQPGFNYYDFGGTMEYEVARLWGYEVFDSASYRKRNLERKAGSIQKAKLELDNAGQLLIAGDQRQARKAFEQALNYSQGQADLNEDARVQLRNLMKQQVKIGLMNRRDVIRYNQNIIQEGEEQVAVPQQETVEQNAQQYLDRIEQRLSEKDRNALEIVADKMIDQQAAAAGVVTAIRVAMPEHGHRLNFKRPLQTDPTEPLTVSFKVGRGGKLGRLLSLWPAFVLFGLTWYGW
ncbi:MAG: hypothetical protein ISS31_06745, partial [Kiritimatiellae bacterium]|nr:hypothetical protein [Kiritimatiellia bacterium]